MSRIDIFESADFVAPKPEDSFSSWHRPAKKSQEELFDEGWVKSKPPGDCRLPFHVKGATHFSVPSFDTPP